MIAVSKQARQLDFHVLANCVPRVPRSHREFAEQEIVPKTGPHANQPLSCDTSPWTGLLLDQLDEDWQTVVITGPNQSGKTLFGLVIPTLHTVVELRENIGVGVPEGDMVSDKWEDDFEPILSNSPNLRPLLPRTGSGSLGGKVKESVTLTNGYKIKFVTRGGQDTEAAGFTARVIKITEAAGFSEVSETSKEGDRIQQLRRRQKAWNRSQRRMSIEGTVTIEQDLPWRLKGTDEEKPISTMSRLLTPCPHCGAWISPEREHLVGWEEAESEYEAAELASFFCPSCGEQLTEQERIVANRDIRLVHLGQSVNEKGEVVGEAPGTNTLWFRYSQWHNLLTPAADAAVEEWLGARIEEGTQEANNAEKELCQSIWCIPYQPPEVEEIPLTRDDVVGRAHEFARARIPEGCDKLGLGIDIRASQIHYAVGAFWPDGRGVAIDFDIIPTDIKKLGLRRGLMEALRKLRDTKLIQGYPGPEVPLVPKYGFIDAGWQPEVVRAFVRESRKLGLRHWYPSFGRGQSVGVSRGGYSHPTAVTKICVYIGDEYHMRMVKNYALPAAFVNSDAWKMRLHEALATPVDQPGSLRMYEPTTEPEQREIRKAARHICNEKAIDKIVQDRGVVRVFVNVGQVVNHYLDAFYLMKASAHRGGVRVKDVSPRVAKKLPAPKRQPQFRPARFKPLAFGRR